MPLFDSPSDDRPYAWLDPAHPFKEEEGDFGDRLQDFASGLASVSENAKQIIEQTPQWEPASGLALGLTINGDYWDFKAGIRWRSNMKVLRFGHRNTRTKWDLGDERIEVWRDANIPDTKVSGALLCLTDDHRRDFLKTLFHSVHIKLTGKIDHAVAYELVEAIEKSLRNAYNNVLKGRVHTMFDPHIPMERIDKRLQDESQGE